MPLRHLVPGIPAILGFVLLLTGCAPSAAPAPPRPTTPTAAEALGDLRTIDPCSMIDPAALTSFGEIRPVNTVSLDYCLHRMRLGTGTEVQVSTGQLGAVPPGNAPRLRRGPVSLVRHSPVPGHCTRSVLFRDGIAVEVSVDLRAGDPAAGLCAVAEAGAESVARRIGDGSVRHRMFPPNSLAWLDPCELVDPAVIHAIPGLEGAAAQRNPAGHQCRWGESRADVTRVRLVHTAGAPPRMLHGAAVREVVAGRDTVLSIVGGDPATPLCSAETAHIPFGDPVLGETEVAMLVVAVPDRTGVEACEFARGLAERVWPRLPAPGGSSFP